MSRIFPSGFAMYTISSRGNWQFAVFTIGHDWDNDEASEAYPFITWYVQFLFWQFSYTREANHG